MRNEDGTYALTIKEYVFDDSGALARIVTLHHLITFNPGADTWTARGAVEVRGLDGAPLRPVVYTSISAARLQVETFPSQQ